MNYTEDKKTYIAPKTILVKLLCEQPVMNWSTEGYEKNPGSEWDD